MKSSLEKADHCGTVGRPATTILSRAASTTDEHHRCRCRLVEQTVGQGSPGLALTGSGVRVLVRASPSPFKLSVNAVLASIFGR